MTFAPKPIALAMLVATAQLASVAHDGDYIQPVFALMHTGLLDSLLEYLNRGERKISKWYDQHKVATVDFSDKPEAFININTPDDIDQIEMAHERRSA